jgi:hypothetical protein
LFNRYNAPEVQSQTVRNLEPKSLHKCDIWAYGLLLWEILADGASYFKKSWRTDPNLGHSRSTGRDFVFVQSDPDVDKLESKSTEPKSTEPLSSFENIQASDGDAANDRIFGNFDKGNLRKLARDFVNSTLGISAFFEKSFLRKLMENALQEDPALRISDLTKTPIMGIWKYDFLQFLCFLDFGSNSF